MIKELTSYIAAALELTIGTDLFALFRPSDAPIACSLILEGPAPEHFFSGEIPEARIQILTRGDDPFAARTAALAIYNILHGDANAGITLPQVGSGPVYFVPAISGIPPQSIGPDENGAYEYSANYTVRYQEA